MNDRQRRFVAEYALDCNGQAAARRAGYRTKNIASDLLRHKEIAAAIAKAEAERSARRRATADRVVEEYSRIAFADMRSFLDWGPDHLKLRPTKDLSEWEGGAIAMIEPRGNGKPGRLRLHDKHAALEILARHTGLFDPIRAMGPRDFRQARRDASAILLERLKRLKKTDSPQG